MKKQELLFGPEGEKLDFVYLSYFQRYTTQIELEHFYELFQQQ
jgi:hypothetical protein